MEDTVFTSPFVYEVSLNKEAYSDTYGYYIVEIDGKEKVIDNNKFKFATIEQLSLFEVAFKLDGTRGIVKVEGSFK